MSIDSHDGMMLTGGLLFILQMTYEYRQSWWNDADRGKSKISEKTCRSATLSTTNPGPPRLEAGN
jgi:hypothetical protein